MLRLQGGNMIIVQWSHDFFPPHKGGFYLSQQGDDVWFSFVVCLAFWNHCVALI